jgi:hypothetical protein
MGIPNTNLVLAIENRTLQEPMLILGTGAGAAPKNNFSQVPDLPRTPKQSYHQMGENVKLRTSTFCSNMVTYMSLQSTLLNANFYA